MMSCFRVDGEYFFFYHCLFLRYGDRGHWLVNMNRLSCYSQVCDDWIGMCSRGLCLGTFCSWVFFVLTCVLVAFGGFFLSVDSSPICDWWWGVSYFALVLRS